MLNCRHCRERFAGRPRGLCGRCYYTPAIVALYPVAASKFNRRGVPDRTGTPPLPPAATHARPGSPEKVAVLESRAELGVALWHPADEPMDRDSARKMGGGNRHMQIQLTEDERQAMLLALARLAGDRPGWVWYLGGIAERLHGREMYAEFLQIRKDGLEAEPIETLWGIVS
ncbi:MAG: hypothetical protein K2R98_28305 [Gemmataceae bacterium]|nr:hypothetical protein [Gemmataceae bacterium]